jgi:hypothetical protein
MEAQMAQKITNAQITESMIDYISGFKRIFADYDYRKSHNKCVEVKRRTQKINEDSPSQLNLLLDDGRKVKMTIEVV